MGCYKPIDLICNDCKKPFTAHSSKALRCPECRRAHQNETVKLWQRVNRAKANQKKCKKPIPLKLSFSEVLRLQEEYNRHYSPTLSYGKFVALLEGGNLDDKIRKISK